MAEPTLLGLDIGATGCKATLYNLDGQPLRTGYAEYQMHSPRPGWVEEDAEDWWRGVVASLRAVTAERELAASIVGLGVGCTNALVAVDAAGEPLRPAIMQLDQRTVPQADWLRQAAGAEALFQTTGNRVAPGSYSAPLILWLKQHEPEVFRAAHKFLVPSGFVVHRLTGQYTMDYSRGSTTALFDVRERAWSSRLCELAGIPRAKLPDLYESWQVVGGVTPQAAAATGLAAGTPVVAGCMDTVGAAVGSGAVLPNEPFAIMGTVARVSVALAEPHFDDRFLNCCHAVPGQWLAIAVMNGAGVSLRWFRDVFGQPEVAAGRELGRDPYDLFTEQAAESPAGAKGLVYLPYLAAERSPIWDPYARGVFFGLSVAHHRGDIIRAMLEGVALSVRHNLQIMEESLCGPRERLRIGGGCARSALWTQIIADATAHSIVTLRASETETLGAAVLAGVGTGAYADFAEARQRTLHQEREFVPNPEYGPLYDDLFAVYLQLYQDLRPRFAEAAKRLQS
ncbi:MAG: FGGY family carbohydrate kinase [Chloroflexi bacterium]|nr:FGGY family carbohydrate kinase [Chloroflexota bacterium]